MKYFQTVNSYVSLVLNLSFPFFLFGEGDGEGDGFFVSSVIKSLNDLTGVFPDVALLLKKWNPVNKKKFGQIWWFIFIYYFIKG